MADLITVTDGSSFLTERTYGPLVAANQGRALVASFVLRQHDCRPGRRMPGGGGAGGLPLTHQPSAAPVHRSRVAAPGRQRGRRPGPEPHRQGGGGLAPPVAAHGQTRPTYRPAEVAREESRTGISRGQQGRAERDGVRAARRSAARASPACRSPQAGTACRSLDASHTTYPTGRRQYSCDPSSGRRTWRRPRASSRPPSAPTSSGPWTSHPASRLRSSAPANRSSTPRCASASTTTSPRTTSGVSASAWRPTSTTTARRSTRTRTSSTARTSCRTRRAATSARTATSPTTRTIRRGSPPTAGRCCCTSTAAAPPGPCRRSTVARSPSTRPIPACATAGWSSCPSRGCCCCSAPL